VNGGCIDVIVDRQGRIVAAAKGANDEILLVRFDSSGARDNAFGVVSTGIPASLATRLADPGMLIAQPDSRYLVGRSNLVRRFNQDGTRDLGYGTNGEVALLPNISIHEILVAPDATTLVGGFNGPAGTSFVASYNANGSPDETFAANGVRTNLSSPISGERVSDILSLAFLPSGDILVGGYDDDDNPQPPSPDLIYFVVTALSFNPGKYPDSTVRLIEFGNPGGLVFASESGVIYRSPDRTRPGGGDDSYRVYGGRYRVSKLERCGSGLVTVFEGLLNKAYYSPDGHHLGGGGSTLYAYNGVQSIHVMEPYQGGLLTAFSNKKIYRSNATCYLPWLGASGFGNVANAAAMPVSIVEFGGGRVMTAYSDGRIYRSPNGTDLGGGGTTVLVHGPSMSIVRTMIAHGSEVLTVFQDQQDRIFASMASGSMIPGPLAGFGPGWKFVTMLPYGTGVIAAWDAGVTKPIYKSPSHNDLAGGPTSTRIYNGSAKVVKMLPYQAGLLTAFTNRGIYYSPNGNNPVSSRIYYYDDWPF
jgi:hypothetical protein